MNKPQPPPSTALDTAAESPAGAARSADAPVSDASPSTKTSPEASPEAGEAPETAIMQRGEAPAKAEYGGPKGLEPTRYGDWERNGRCYDF